MYIYTINEIEQIARYYRLFLKAKTPELLDSKADFDMALRKLPDVEQLLVKEFILDYDEYDRKEYPKELYEAFAKMAKYLGG